MKIAFVNGKGGTGKSTLCFLTWLALGEAGRSARVVDLDPQRSLSAWLGDHGGGDQGGAITTLIDTRPALDDFSVIESIASADLVIMPVTPSPADLLAGKATAATIKAHLSKRGRALVVLNRLKVGTSLSSDARELAARIGLPIAKTEIPERQSIQRALIGGWRELDPATRETVLALAIEFLTP